MSDKHRATLLLDEPPILVYPTLAKALGINKAVIMQQLHFLLNATKTANNHYNFVDGRWWVYNSYEEWTSKYFPWLSPGGLKRMMNDLEDERFLLTRQSVKVKSDRRKWYTIDYEAWEQFVLTIGAKCSDGSTAQNVPMIGAKSADGYSETPTETPTKTPEPISPNGDKPNPSKEKKERKPPAHAPQHDALIAAFKLKPEQVTPGRDKSFWNVAAQLRKVNFPAEHIGALHTYIASRAKAEGWKSWGENALAKYAPDFMALHPELFNQQPQETPVETIAEVPDDVKPLELTPEQWAQRATQFFNGRR
jgi:hypothetical protein